MFDLSIELKKFYYNEVVLSSEETKNLREKKKLNIKRLREGLSDYNADYNTNYAIAETLEQGSVAMSTVTQNEKNDYDIDVAIIFDESNLNGLGPIAVKNVVADALKRKCTNFKTQPESKTNCVRIVYSDNYHIDFAIYRRIRNDDGSYNYEHAGSEWRPRDPRAINKWFRDEIKEHTEDLRKVVRLLKMFSKSRELWKMPGGLIQSVLSEEKIQNYKRMDELFFYTIREISVRLKKSIEVYNPTDDTQSLLLKQSDYKKMSNLCNRLENKLSALDILFDNECTKKDAVQAWYEIFNHDYWTYKEDENNMKFESFNKSFDTFEYDDTEEYIRNIVPVSNKYKITLDCRVIDKNGTIKKLSTIYNNGKSIPLNRKLLFYLDENRVPKPYDIYWKVKNEGVEAIERNCIRGQIFKNADPCFETIEERSDFVGNHYVECYIIKNGVCVAKDRIDVNI
ncbi:nucleotidyltransferase [Clostridioides difficile]|uniref:nucleotide-binding domain-containing protein n=1 Tax=Clostridioides difficile TaxID=1496 RepID=UPI002030EC87|nr:nucleotidyltransferase [Clostridioides difficile]MCM0739833.1 nucleotidyltransferase [Clostridioides difficile]HBF2930776.1 nucleotidyltransferase [Clostridioides difficile]HBF2935761.1 nucleotidyltransferase [Clostridioides difficile]HBZ0282956.1 nucleotidyltransferase [Clostridioides difficile]